MYLVKLIPTALSEMIDLRKAWNFFLMLLFKLNVYNISLTVGQVKLFWDCNMVFCLVRQRKCTNTEKTNKKWYNKIASCESNKGIKQ